jgi:hypothetical protein
MEGEKQMCFSDTTATVTAFLSQFWSGACKLSKEESKYVSTYHHQNQYKILSSKM